MIYVDTIKLSSFRRLFSLIHSGGMGRFFLLVALFISALHAQETNYTGVCSLQPFEEDKTQYIMCLPNKAKAFEFGDYFRIRGVKTDLDRSGNRNPWTINLLSAEFKTAFHLAIRPGGNYMGYVVANTNSGQWHTGGWGREEFHDIDFPLDDRLEIKITNAAKGIEMELSGADGKPEKNSFIYVHRTPNPATDYKYLHLTQMPEKAHVEYHHHRDSSNQEINFSKEVVQGFLTLKKPWISK